MAQAAEAHGLDPYIATGRHKHSDPPPIAPRGTIPKHATPKQRMARKNRTRKGQAVYARRKAIVEPVFGQMQTVQGARHLLLRGKDAARAQWRFQCALHNLLKLHRAGWHWSGHDEGPQTQLDRFGGASRRCGEPSGRIGEDVNPDCARSHPEAPLNRRESR